MKKQAGYTLIEMLVVLSFLFGLTVVGGLIYTAIHFISKVW